MKSNFIPYSNISKYNDNRRISNNKDYNLNNINNNVFNVNSYQINSSPKIFKYSIKNNIDNSPFNTKKSSLNNQKNDRNNKFIKDSSFTSKKLTTLNSAQDNLNNSLSKHSRMNRSSKYYFPNIKEKYAINKNNKIYNESDYNDSINNAYYKSRHHSKSPSINRRKGHARMAHSSYNVKRNYSNKFLKPFNTICNKMNNDFSRSISNSKYFNNIIYLKDNKINQLNKKINELTNKLNEKNNQQQKYFNNNELFNDNSDDNKFSNFGKLNNQTRMLNLLNQQNQRLKEENVRLGMKINSVSRQNQKILNEKKILRTRLTQIQNEKNEIESKTNELIKQFNILLNDNEMLKEIIEKYNGANSNVSENNSNDNNEDEDVYNYMNNNNTNDMSFYLRQINLLKNEVDSLKKEK